MRVCLDNNMLIWGVRGVATAGQESNVIRARQLLDDLDADGAEIVVSAVVVGEFLTAIPESAHVEMLDVLNRCFQVAPFDALAAAKAAAVWRGFAETNAEWRHELRVEVPGIERARIKADIQILASALTRRADRLYTHDAGLIKLATGHIEIRGLPELRPTQGELLK